MTARPERSSGAQQNTNAPSVDVLAAQVRAGIHPPWGSGMTVSTEPAALAALDVLVGYAKRAEELERITEEESVRRVFGRHVGGEQ